MKLLIIRFSAIGDILLTFHVIDAIKKTHPTAEIHVLTKTENAPIFEGLDVSVHLHTLNTSLFQSAQSLKKERFTHVIDLHNNLRTRLLQILMLRWEWSRFPKLNFKKWLFSKFKVNTLPNIHVVDRYLMACHKLKLDASTQKPSLKLLDQGVAVFDLEKSKYVAWVLGAKLATKQMPLVKIKEVASQLNLPIVLLGGATEQAMSLELAQAYPNVLNLVGKTSLWESAEVLRYAKVTVTNDTGLMHLASFFSTPMLVIWGNTTPDFGMYPYQTDGVFHFQVEGLSCRPCSKIGHSACPKGHFNCMLQQDAAQITAQINALYRQEN